MLTPQRAMERAIQISEHARLQAPPNPWVGCVLVRDGCIVGEGCSLPAGQNHAEIQALKQAGAAAKGATAFVTLEPCSHHGRTPPCTDALIRAGVVKVVAAIQDPDKRVSGRGLQQLQQAGIATELGLCSDVVKASLKPYLHHRMTGLPFCVAKAAISIDGRMAAQDGSSQWITEDLARLDSHKLRAQSQAILIGSGTAIHDKPKLTVRYGDLEKSRQPLRVVLDASGRIPLDSPLFDTSLAPTLVLTTEEVAHERWKDHGVEVAVVPTTPLGIDLKACLKLLGGRGILQLLVEGGPTLLGSLWKEQLIDQLSLYVGPRILGECGKPLFAGLEIPNISTAPILSLIGSEQLGSCFRLDYVTQPKVASS